MLNPEPLKILIVDDTAIFRKIIKDILIEIPDVEVVGVAQNGNIALKKLSSLKPDLLILDIEMPEMNGIEVLKYLRNKDIDIGAVMLSSLTQTGSAITIKALELGAFDFIAKPQGNNLEENKQAVKNSITPILKAFARKKVADNALKNKITRKSVSSILGKRRKASLSALSTNKPGRLKKERAELVAIGISTGGPNALASMLPEIPGDIGVPILIVQHMPPVFTESLAKSLNAKCSIKVKEAVNREPLIPNTAYIAPGGKQMKIASNANGKNRVIKITDDPPENSCKPSADYLFRSVSQHYTGSATGIIMTGMGADGTQGLKLMHESGSTIIAQDKASCIVYGMPKEAIEAGIVDVIVPLDRIAGKISETVSNKLNKKIK